MMNLEGVGKGNSQTLTTEKGSPPTAEWKGSVTKVGVVKFMVFLYSSVTVYCEIAHLPKEATVFITF